MIEKDDNKETKKIEELELKNIEELLSLERLIFFFEDIKNIENSNLNFLNKTLDEVEFNNDLIIGNLGNICKTYFETYYEIRKKFINNIKELINLMKLKSFSKSTKEKDEFVIVFNNDNLQNMENKEENEKYIYKEDIFEIIESLLLINQYNNEINENFETNLNKKLKNLKETENFKELDILKEDKKEKIQFEEKLKDICKTGLDSSEFNEIKNLLINDNSEKQTKACWMIEYLNNNRSKLSSISQIVFRAFKELFEITIDKLYDRKLYDPLDLTIVLLQTFSTKKDNNNYLLEEEFKGKELFQNEDLWKNIILFKIDELFKKTKEEKKDKNGTKEYINFIKENIEPILLSYIFSMKDFNLSKETKRKIIEDVCKSEKILEYEIDIEKLMAYS
jgi:hypothetical protein